MRIRPTLGAFTRTLKRALYIRMGIRPTLGPIHAHAKACALHPNENSIRPWELFTRTLKRALYVRIKIRPAEAGHYVLQGDLVIGKTAGSESRAR